jgi:hypothetical protein
MCKTANKAKPAKTPSARPSAARPILLEEIQIVLISEPTERQKFQRLLRKHHYLGGIKAVGEQLYYRATDRQGRWVALLLFSAAAKHLRARDQWIGWDQKQRDRRLALIANNCRYAILPQYSVPNLGSRVLRLTLDRLSDDWQAQYGHPILIVETFVDPEQFCGTVYTANNWVELGKTDGWGRHQRDYYVKHDRPKQLFVRELAPNARRSLQAEHLKPELAVVEKKTTPRCYQTVPEIQSIAELFQAVPDYRQRFESYPVWSLLTLILLALLCEAPRGQKDLAKFARRLTQAQRRALGFRDNVLGRYPAPCQSTFSRLFKKVGAPQVHAAILQIQEKIRGPQPQKELVVIDGKEPRHGPGDSILSGVTVPSLHYTGSAVVNIKTNEIPVAREIFGQMDLSGRRVSLDALHTQNQTACELGLQHGADYLLTVKGNQPTLHKNIKNLIPVVPTGFSPSGNHGDAGPQGGEEQGPMGKPNALHTGRDARTDRFPLGRASGQVGAAAAWAPKPGGGVGDESAARRIQCEPMAVCQPGCLGN